MGGGEDDKQTSKPTAAEIRSYIWRKLKEALPRIREVNRKRQEKE